MAAKTLGRQKPFQDRHKFKTDKLEIYLHLLKVNQIELHPWQRKEDIVEYCRKNGIAVMGYSPLTKGQRLGDPDILKLSEKYGRTPEQILIRWSVQSGARVHLDCSLLVQGSYKARKWRRPKLEKYSAVALEEKNERTTKSASKEPRR